MKFGEAKCWIFGKNDILYGMRTVSDKLYCLDCFNTAQDHATVASQPHDQSGSIDLYVAPGPRIIEWELLMTWSKG